MVKTILKIFVGLILGVGAWMLAWPNLLLLLILCLLIVFLLVWPKIFLRLVIGVLAFVLLVWLLIQTSPVQNYIADKIATRLSNDLNTTVRIGRVDLSLFDKMDLNNTLILDQNKDTLLKAGSLKLRITDWFFLKENIELKYIGLEDAVINQQRTDSVWNYQFLIDHFTKPQKSKTHSKKIILKIQKIDLKNVVYNKYDNWIGQHTILKTGSFLLDADNIDITKNLILINTIDMDKTFYTIEKFTGKKPAVKPTQKDSGLYLNPSGLIVKIASLKMKDCMFATGTKGEIPRKNIFDGKHVEISKINGSINNFSFLKDTIKANINLSASERSGLKIKKLQTAFRLTPHIMEFSKLLLQTNKSTLNNYYAMQYKDLNTDMLNYVTNVTMKAVLRNSSISTDDVAYFAPGLNKWNEKFLVNGKLAGTVSDFSIQNLFLRSSSNTFVSGDLAVKGLPDANKTTITLKQANVQTNSREIAFIVPAISTIKSPDLAALGNVHFVGNFSGTLHNVNAKGALSSALGGITADIVLSFPLNAQPSYKGIVETQQFNLGKFLLAPDLGNVSFKGDVEGSSFQLAKISTRLNGKFNSLTFKDYTYSNLTFNGEIKQKNFKGDFKSEDTNFIFTSNIIIDLNGDAPSFNVLGDLVTANLKALKFSKDSVAVTGLFDLDFRGHNIDDFLGYAKILNASITHNNQRLDFDSLTLTTSLDSLNKNKKLLLESNEFVVSVEGQYKILELPQSFQSFLNHYYPSYINPPKNELSNQNFTASISTGDFDRYAKLIDSNLSGFNNAFLSGKISTLNGNKFNLDISIPEAKYKRYSLEEAKFTGVGDNDSLLLDGDIGKIYLSDSMYFPNTKISVHSANDLSHIKISTRANATLNDAELDADLHTMTDGLKIDFHPSSFVLNDKRWNLENQGEVVIARHSASAKNMKFTQGFQEISIESVNEADSASNTLAVRLKDVDFGDILPLVLPKPLMEGIANGDIYLRDIYTEFHADANLRLTQFRLNNDSIGVVDVGAKYNAANGKITYNVKADDENFVMNADGSYNTKDLTNNPLQTNIALNHAKVGILNSFLGTLFDDITGLATGNLTIHGDLKNIMLTGKAHLDSGALTVKFTKVRYTIPSADFVLTDDAINFGNFVIKDKFGNTGNVKGVLYETAFKNNRYDLDLSTDKLLLFDTKAKDNDHFYGDVIGKATLSLKGPQENLQMNVSGEAVETSHIYIPTDNSKKSTEADYIVFKQYGTQVQPEVPANTTNLNINLDLNANNKAIVSVILDELTGDIIEATGNGRLLIKIPAKGDITMNGRYNIEQGNYNFNFQSLVKKPFELLPDQNSYIEWNGDPFDASIKITARYTAKNVSLGDLVSSTPFTLNGAVQGYRGDVYVIADLSGKLSKPDIHFRLDFPQGSAIRNDDNFNRLLAKITSDENEMLKQVTWLIVFDSFSPYGELATNQGFVQSTGINTISQKVASVLNNAVSDLLYKLTGDKSLQFNVGAKTYSSYSLNGTASGSTLDRTAVDLKLNKSLLNNNLIITFGGDLDFGVSGAAAATSNSFQWLPDISVQIILTRDKKLRAIIFNRSSLATTANGAGSGTIGRVTKQGISISYTKDFDKFFGGNDNIYFLQPKQKDSLSIPQKSEK